MRSMMARATLVLGYLHLDGEGTKEDKLEAVKFLKVSSSLGNTDAQKTLGFLYNTGQFGN